MSHRSRGSGGRGRGRPASTRQGRDRGTARADVGNGRVGGRVAGQSGIARLDDAAAASPISTQGAHLPCCSLTSQDVASKYHCHLGCDVSPAQDRSADPESKYGMQPGAVSKARSQKAGQTCECVARVVAFVLRR